MKYLSGLESTWTEYKLKRQRGNRETGQGDGTGRQDRGDETGRRDRETGLGHETGERTGSRDRRRDRETGQGDGTGRRDRESGQGDGTGRRTIYLFREIRLRFSETRCLRVPFFCFIFLLLYKRCELSSLLAISISRSENRCEPSAL